MLPRAFFHGAPLTTRTSRSVVARPLLASIASPPKGEDQIGGQDDLILLPSQGQTWAYWQNASRREPKQGRILLHAQVRRYISSFSFWVRLISDLATSLVIVTLTILANSATPL